MAAELKTNIQIKGIRDGLLVTLDEGDWLKAQEALLEQIDRKSDFFAGARLALDVGNRVLHAAELGTLRDRLSDRNVALWAVVGSSTVTEKTSQALGLATRLHTPKPERVSTSMDTHLEGEGAVLVQRTLRSGFKVSTHGHVVVIGDINPGAEVVAGGSVVVWGRLKGSVHAGAEGDELAVVCALEMAPVQLRIANRVALAPSFNRKTSTMPAIASIKDSQVTLDVWKPKR